MVSTAAPGRTGIRWDRKGGIHHAQLRRALRSPRAPARCSLARTSCAWALPRARAAQRRTPRCWRGGARSQPVTGDSQCAA
jgi:hypothetical protein